MIEEVSFSSIFVFEVPGVQVVQLNYPELNKGSIVRHDFIGVQEGSTLHVGSTIVLGQGPKAGTKISNLLSVF